MPDPSRGLYYAALGAIVLRARKRKKLTQAALAKQLGVSQPTVARLEAWELARALVRDDGIGTMLRSGTRRPSLLVCRRHRRVHATRGGRDSSRLAGASGSARSSSVRGRGAGLTGAPWNHCGTPPTNLITPSPRVSAARASLSVTPTTYTGTAAGSTGRATTTGLRSAR